MLNMSLFLPFTFTIIINNENNHMYMYFFFEYNLNGNIIYNIEYISIYKHRLVLVSKSLYICFIELYIPNIFCYY